jgi:hypothetical protein
MQSIVRDHRPMLLADARCNHLLPIVRVRLSSDDARTLLSEFLKNEIPELRAQSGEPQCASGRHWWSWTGSNRRPPACKAGALPTELQPRGRTPRRNDNRSVSKVVGLVGLEPTTPRLSSACSNHLSYRPGSVEHENVTREEDALPG